MKSHRLFSGLVSLALATGAMAQSTNASLTGFVDDPSKAMVTHASVTAINTETSVKTQTTTNNSGQYVLEGLPPGTYRIEVDKQGFKGIIEAGLVLHVQDVVQINFHMAPGSMSETVTVNADTVNINTTDGSVSTVIDQRMVKNLPLNGRSFQTLLLLTPGATVTPATYASQGQFSVNGQRGDTNYFTVDGVSANNGVSTGNGLLQSAAGSLPGLTPLGSTQSLLSVDAMQEFRVTTSTFAPEYGRTPGAQVSVQSKSGTNEWHGSAFEYLRNDVLDANNWFADSAHLVKPKERQNDFGGVFGGPIHRNSTFFFFSYEGLRLVQPATETTLTVSNAARALLPASVTPLVNLLPTSTGPDLGNGTASLTANYTNPSSVDAYSIRVDQNLGSKTVLFARYSDTPSTANTTSAYVISDDSRTLERQRSGTLGLTQQLSKHLTNELRASYANAHSRNIWGFSPSYGANPLSTSSLFNALNYPGTASPDSSFVLFQVTAFGGTAAAGLNAENEQRSFNIVDDVSLVKGTHHMKAGVDYRWMAPIGDPRAYSMSLTFSSVLGGTGTLQSGAAQLASVTNQLPSTTLIKNFSAFAQDTWMVNRRLTMTYGVRWDVNPPYRSKDPNHPFYTVQGASNPATMTLAPAGTPAYSTSWADISPRFGMAYTLHSQPGFETVLRAGFGEFFDIGDSYLEGEGGYGWPFSAVANYPGAPVPLTSVQAARPVPNTNYPVNAALYVADPNFVMPKTWQYNVALEQGLGKAQSLSLTYVGATGRNLAYSYILYVPSTRFTSSVGLTNNQGTSDYDSLQVQYKKQLSHGLQALAQYTWSHAIDTGSAASSGNPPVVASSAQSDRGPADFDTRNSFSGSIVYDVPRFGNRFERAIFGGWSVSDLVLAHSANPFTPQAGVGLIGGYLYVPRPNRVQSQPLYLYNAKYPTGRAFNPAAFSNPANGTQGNLGRNALLGFGAWQTDLAIRREFPITEKIHFQFSGEMFNLLNHPNFGAPTASTSSALFGQATTTLATSLQTSGAGLSSLYQIGGPRSIQVVGRISF